jgi:predicted PurR-regulated permease PerM
MNTQHPFLTRGQLFGFTFFAVFLFLLYQLWRLLAPFLSALLWAAILALALAPLYGRIVRLLRGRKTAAATITTGLTLLLVIGPAVSALFLLGSQAVDLYHWIASAVASGKLTGIWGRLTAALPGRFLSFVAPEGLDIKALVIKGLGNASSLLASQIGSVLKNTVLFVVDIAVMLVALFFFFRDGETYAAAVFGLLPFPEGQKKAIANKFFATFRAVINGVFLIALMQGVMTGIGFALFGLPFAVFWGFIAAILALLPVGGSALIWLPGAIYLVLSGLTLNGILLGAWGLVLVSTPDNFLKPILIGRKARIPTFFLFVTLLGGLEVFGVLGLLFGPVILTLLTAFVEIYREEYAEI